MMLSTSTSIAPEAVGEVGPARWMQLYWMNDRELTRSIVQRAEASGFLALALTVDAPRLGWREMEYRLATGMSRASRRRCSRSRGRRTEGRVDPHVALARVAARITGCPSCSRA